jgi:hypothetical protein
MERTEMKVRKGDDTIHSLREKLSTMLLDAGKLTAAGRPTMCERLA